MPPVSTTKRPPQKRENWDRLNYGQQLYAVREYIKYLERRNAHVPNQLREFKDKTRTAFDDATYNQSSQSSQESEAPSQFSFGTIEDIELDSAQWAELDRIVDAEAKRLFPDPSQASMGHVQNGNDPKRQKLDTSGPIASTSGASTSAAAAATPATAMETDNIAGSGSNAGGSGISHAALQFYKHLGLHSEGNIIRYQHSFRLRSFGNKLLVQPGATTATTLNHSSIVYPYVSLPVEYLWFYIPRGVFYALATLPQCKPKRVACKVTPIGQMVSFSTNTSTTNSGTTSHTLYGLGNVGLNYKLPIDKVDITRNATDPIVIDSAVTWSNSGPWIERLWGQSLPTGQVPYSVAFLESIANSAQNAEIIIPNTYLRVHMPMPPPDVATQIGTDVSSQSSFWSMGRYLAKCPIHPHTGVPILNMSYTHDHWPMLSTTTAATRYYAGAKTHVVPVTRRGKRGRQSLNQNATTFATTLQANQTDTDQTVNASDFHTNTIYEQFSLNTTIGQDILGNEPKLTGPCVPSCIFGIEAVQANVPEAGSPSYINSSCDWYIETEIEFQFGIQNEFNFANATGDAFHELKGQQHQIIGIDEFAGNTILQRNIPTRCGLQLFQ